MSVSVLSPVVTLPDRILSSIDNYTGYSVDIATIEQNVNKIGPSEAYQMTLSPQYISYATFKALFYKDLEFELATIREESVVFDLISTAERTVLSGPLSNINPTYEDEDLNLLKSLLEVYKNDLDIDIDCWDTCSLLNFQQTINRIKSLNDLAGKCSSNVKCSLCLGDFFNSLEAQGLVMDDLTGLPLDPSQNVTGNRLYNGLVSANVITVFKSSTPGVKDLQVNWPFLVNFNSYEGGPTGASMTGNDVWTDISDNEYPYFWARTDDTLTIVTSPIAENRSDLALKYNTVDKDGVAMPLVGGNHPAYNRYTANAFSDLNKPKA